MAHALNKIFGEQTEHSVDGNELFVAMPQGLAEYLWRNGAPLYFWSPGVYRLVTSWAMTEKEVRDFIQLCTESD